VRSQKPSLFERWLYQRPLGAILKRIANKKYDIFLNVGFAGGFARSGQIRLQKCGQFFQRFFG